MSKAQKLREAIRRVERFYAAVEQVPHTLESLKGPNWIPWYMFHVVSLAIEELRRAIEDPSNSEVTWETPAMEIRWPIEWDREQDVPRLFPIIDLEDLEGDPKDVARRAVDLAWEGLLPLIVHTLSYGAHIKIRDGEYLGCLEQNTVDPVIALPEHERQALLDTVFGPITLLGERGNPDHSVYTLEVEESWVRLERVPAPSLRFNATDDDTDAPISSGYVLAQVYPLVCDEDSRDAYVSMVVGLVSNTEERLPEGLGVPGFWADILSTIDGFTNDVEPPGVDALMSAEIAEALREGRFVVVPRVSAEQTGLVQCVRAFGYRAAAHVEVTQSVEGLEQLSLQPPVRVEAVAKAHEVFPAPPGLRWEEVSMVVLPSDTEIRIKARGISRLYNFTQLGCADGRTGREDMIWGTILTFASCNGEISWGEKSSSVNHGRLKAHVKELRKRLCAVLGIEGDPFEKYREVKAYRSKFTIRKGS